jgi:Tol biopolymer transport system component/tRNA A-37 threonylcarbamoyl transferase component Bud32
MALNPGIKLGSYEIISLVGVGGMGEVYRAKDTRLGRDVALKILPAGFARNADRLRRFEQEARAVAALNHPNILAIHDIGQQDDTPFLVSELLEGESLRAILDRGALPQRKAIDYGVQTAQGLAAAHEKGIVHRDLKPENLFITKDGRVKILDFGLAKLAPQKSDGAPDAVALTLTHEQTQAGVVMGTAGYMAPEQVRGEAADPRTDIFAFGAVLFEMLSGQRAFRRDTAAETMTAVLKDDPPELAMSEHAVTPALDRIMKRCLEKSPEQRFQSAKDLAFALEALSGSAASTAKQQAIPAARKNKWMPAAAACIAIAAIAAAYLIGSRTTEKPASFTRLTFQRGYIKRARFAPDGQNVIYSAAWEGRPFEIFSTKIGDNTSRPLGLTDAMALGVSDSGEIALLMNVRRVRDTAFLYKGTLARAQDSGGTPREILDDVWDADISRDGKQFAVVRAAAGPQQLEYPIGKVLFKTDGYISDPRISPDGKSVAFMEHPLFGDDRGYVSVVDSNGNAKRLTTDASTEQGVVWSRDGKEIWFAASEAGTTSGERAVWAVTPAGKMRKVFQVPEDCTAADIAADGRLLFTNDKVSGAQMVASPASSVERDVSVLGSGYSGSISADGKMIAFTESGSGVGDDYAVFFRRLDGSPAVELGEGDCIGMTPDGKYVVALLPTQPTKLRVLPTGAGEARTFDIAPVSVDVDDVSWMPGAKEFVFLGHEGVGPPHAYRVSIDGGSARPLTNQAGAHFWNRVSLDGKYLIDGPGKGNNWQSKWELVELATGQARPAALLDGDQPASWDQDNKHIFVAHEGDGESTVFRVDAFSGERKVWKQIQPADPSGLNLISFFQVTPSGSAYSYGAGRMISSLYVYSK